MLWTCHHQITIILFLHLYRHLECRWSHFNFVMQVCIEPFNKERRVERDHLQPLFIVVFYAKHHILQALVRLCQYVKTVDIDNVRSQLNFVIVRYGEDVGALTDNSLYAVGQTVWAGHNIACLGVKGVAKRVAKDTGKALVHQHEEKKAATQTVEEAEEAKEDAEKDGGEELPVRPVREKKKHPL